MVKNSDEYIFEYIHIANSIKISVVCVKTKLETSVIVPAKMSEFYMQKIAIKKLNYLKNKNLDK